MQIRLLTMVAVLGATASIDCQENPAGQAKTGSVAGVVIDEKSGDRVPKAVVILRRDQESGIADITGSDGKFTLGDVEPGSYVLAVERDGYVVAPGQSQTVSVEASQTTSDVKVQLVRTGAISGRILDADGDPVSGVNVVVAARGARKGTRGESGSAITNDRGEYRIFHIAPGEYRMSATYTPRSRLDRVRLQPHARSGAASGGDAYPTVYYPGTTDPRQAVALNVGPGAELQGFNLQLIRAHGVRVRGRVAATSGSGPAPPFQMVALSPIGRRDSAGGGHDFLIRDASGEFEFEGVLPGRYRLQVEFGGLNEPSRMSARRTLEVGDSDIEGIEVTPAQPRSLSGRVIAPEGRKLPVGLVVMLGAREAGDTQGGGLAQVGADGAFTMLQVPPGDYDAVVGSTTGGDDDAYIHAIRMGDTDALAEGVHVGEGQLATLEIVLKANGGAAECIVRNDKGDPVPDADIRIVPDVPRQRQAALFGNCRTRADGTCKIVGITPGEYHVYAFPAGVEIDHRDLDSMKPFEKYGEAMKFAEGERKQLNLKTAQIE
jgi:protocatechuate 3,4-dioxygenase beta subunit